MIVLACFLFFCLFLKTMTPLLGRLHENRGQEMAEGKGTHYAVHHHLVFIPIISNLGQMFEEIVRWVERNKKGSEAHHRHVIQILVTVPRG